MLEPLSPRGQGGPVTTGPEAPLCAGQGLRPHCVLGTGGSYPATTRGPLARAWSRAAWAERPVGLQISVWTGY